uniref:Ribonuclease A-domain domain-containing protein n=1 Tax=Sphenodon punctatus TaxID=8508 RepID=A0A8D0G568_SPHPU
MAGRWPRPTLLVLSVLLAAAWLALAAAETRYEKFLRQHVDWPQTSAADARRYCNLLMQRRGMATASSCKRLNTFIHADPAQVAAVCGSAGDPTSGDQRQSKGRFSLTVCELQGGSQAPDCQYKGSTSTQRIVIACVNGDPVHFEKQL